MERGEGDGLNSWGGYAMRGSGMMQGPRIGVNWIGGGSQVTRAEGRIWAEKDVLSQRGVTQVGMVVVGGVG